MSFLTQWYLAAVQHPSDSLWTAFGFVGTGLFAARFLVQWLASERTGHSVVPVSFWYFSLGGGFLTLIYTIHLASAPLMLSQSVPLAIYARNLYLISRDRRKAAAA